MPVAHFARRQGRSVGYYPSYKEKQRILETLPFQVGRLPVKYLGIPLFEGDLGLKPLDKWNEALLIKHIWKLVSNQNSFGRKALLELRGKVRPHIIHVIGNRSAVSMWHDFWHSIGPL
ncbi:hypothetical protein Tco_1296851 [Tanacetum coccineum]